MRQYHAERCSHEGHLSGYCLHLAAHRQVMGCTDKLCIYYQVQTQLTNLIQKAEDLQQSILAVSAHACLLWGTLQTKHQNDNLALIWPCSLYRKTVTACLGGCLHCLL